ncbi:hypothetical protein E2C01_090263 [Portunus trituberculatus]|uniref:Uncharacterized protein n=1 Tax=Portunus trituberculatus TaxID=210409 RepID=A0A5B7JPP4_PORTR|nr:hypothetical protein [Portunus trituberculatus]
MLAITSLTCPSLHISLPPSLLLRFTSLHDQLSSSNFSSDFPATLLPSPAARPYTRLSCCHPGALDSRRALRMSLCRPGPLWRAWAPLVTPYASLRWRWTRGGGGASGPTCTTPQGPNPPKAASPPSTFSQLVKQDFYFGRERAAENSGTQAASRRRCRRRQVARRPPASL